MLLACDGDSPSNADPSPPPSSTEAVGPTASAVPSTPTPIPEPNNTRPFPPDLLERVQPILDKTAQVRGTPPMGEVQMRLVGRQDAIDNYKLQYEAEAEQIAVQQDVYRHLGLIADDLDLMKMYLRFLELGILAFYSPEHKTFYLIEDQISRGVLTDTTLVHEYAHALQDQYHDLDPTREAIEDDWDRSSAYTTLIEGDAVSTENAYFGFVALRRPMCFAIPPVQDLLGIPFAIQRDINTWYDDGFCFVQTVTERGTMSTAPLFENPPVSTEQILHPDKYTAGEKPEPVTLSPVLPALGAGWAEIESSTLGEYILQNVLVLGLRLRGDRPRAQAGAAGWGGDAWTLYGNGEARLFQASIVWDSAEEAQQFFTTLSASLEARGGGVQPASEAGFSARLGAKDWRVGLRGDAVTLLVSADAGALSAAAGAIGLP